LNNEHLNSLEKNLHLVKEVAPILSLLWLTFSHYLLLYILLAVLGSFLAALNKFIADRYSWNHSLSEYHVYEFFKVNMKSWLP